jgi:Expansin C-terminal domain
MDRSSTPRLARVSWAGIVPLALLGGLMVAGCRAGSPAAPESGGAKGAGGAQGPGGAQGSGGSSSTSGSRAVGGAQEAGGAQGAGGGQGIGGSNAMGGAQAGGGAGGASTTKADAGTDGPMVDAPLAAADTTATTADARTQGPRPDASADSCGAWAMTNGVCCAQYCSNDDKSESCDKCGGPGSALCQVVNAKACTSGQWPEVHSVSDNEDWHYSRSTHFGTAPMGACAFGLYGVCSSAMKLANTNLQAQCDTFCKATPDLCKDPSNVTLRGNFAAPQGNYYTQFWSSLPGDLDNYLSCGECFELERTQDDGTEYQSGAGGYTPPIVLQVADSCPCSANSKWCCGSGRDHCGEVKGVFKYGCQLPPASLVDPEVDPPLDHDPLPNESMHLDLSDIAMSRLQTGDPNGTITDGVIPTKYKRVPCPVVGNMHIWLRPNGNEYYFALTVVNVAGLGAAAKVEAQLPSGDWILLKRDSNYSLSRPQERFGTWALPQGYGPFSLPVTLRVTDGSGRAVVAKDVIKTFAPADSSLSENWFIDTGVQF